MIRPQDSHHWFGRTFREFSALTLPLAGKPICYVEVGVFMADSAAWVCENILTHPESRGLGIDPYEADWKRGEGGAETIRLEAFERMRRFPIWSWAYRKSQDVLRQWESTKIDLLYLDGSHIAHDVLTDWCLAFRHLKEGSLVIFDDYGLSKRKKDQIARVDIAVAAIESTFAPFVERVGLWRTQAAFRIVKEPVIGELP